MKLSRKVLSFHFFLKENKANKKTNIVIQKNNIAFIKISNGNILTNFIFQKILLLFKLILLSCSLVCNSTGQP